MVRAPFFFVFDHELFAAKPPARYISAEMSEKEREKRVCLFLIPKRSSSSLEAVRCSSRSLLSDASLAVLPVRCCEKINDRLAARCGPSSGGAR